MLLCKNCGNKTILAMAVVTNFDPDEEPYEDGVQEKCDYEDGIPIEVSVGIHWCPKCENIEDVWIEEPMEKDARDAQLQAENEQLKQGIIDDRDAPVVLMPRELYDKLQAEVDKLKKAMALANSMLLAGERPSDKSKAIFDQALKDKP